MIPADFLDPRRRAYLELCAREKRRRLKAERRAVPPLEKYGPPSTRYNPQPKHLWVERELDKGRRHNLLVGGSRSGKTFIFVKKVIERACLAPETDHLITRFRTNAAKQSIWLGTLPLVRRMCFPNLQWSSNNSDLYVTLDNGSRIWVSGLDEKQRVEKILGNEYVTIYNNEASQTVYQTILIVRTRLAQVGRYLDGRALPQQEYVDLNPVGKSHYSYKEWIEGVNPENRKPIPHHDRDYFHAFLQPHDNAANLDPAYLESLANAPERTRKRFYEGQYVEEIEGALWVMEALDHARVDADDVPATMDRVVVAVDPSGTDGDEDTRSDDVGIVVAGRQGTGDTSVGWLLEDATSNVPPLLWGQRVVALYRKWQADKIVAEANFGGEMVRAVIDAAARSMNVVLPPVELVRASRGKAVRAEPISVLAGHQRDGEWLGDRVKHAGEFNLLEEELLNFSTHGYMGPRSPNRADAYVWAMTDLMLGEQLPGLWSRSDLEVVE